MRRFLTVIVVLVLLAVVVDRAACWFAQRTIAEKIQEDENLSARPDVSVHGFPFLTQVLGGRYKQIDATLKDPAVEGGLKIDTLNVRLRGVRVSTGDVINREVHSVPVDSATAVATVSFAALDAAAKENLPNTQSKVAFSQGPSNALRVTGEYRSSGLNARLDLTAKIVAKDGDLVVELAPEALTGLPAILRPQVKQLLAQASRLPSLPFGFQATSVGVSPTGITVQASSSALNLQR